MYNLYKRYKNIILEIICNKNFLLEINRVSHFGIENPNDVCLFVGKQLDEYFLNKRKEFLLSIRLSGTEFQKIVWGELLKIPYGETLSYQEVANRLKKPKLVRAVANAIGKNKILIVVPCHRVIGTNGSLTGFSAGLDFKKELLKKEKIKIGSKNENKKTK